MTITRLTPANDNLPRVIGFTGVAGSGKSTAADYVVSLGYVKVKFAAPIKAMCHAIGLTDEEIEGGAKELPCDLLLGRSPRHAMQTLGTDWGRKMIGEGFWLHLWKTQVARALDQGLPVVVDDVRFPNEADAIRQLGGEVYRVVGRGGIVGWHESERIDVEVDGLIHNNSSRQDLEARVVRALAA